MKFILIISELYTIELFEAEIELFTIHLERMERRPLPIKHAKTVLSLVSTL